MARDASDDFLHQARDFHRMVRVEIDSGYLMGYVIGFDEIAIILYANFTAGEAETIQSAFAMVPRDKVVIYTNRTVNNESKEFQEIYREAMEAK